MFLSIWLLTQRKSLSNREEHLRYARQGPVERNSLMLAKIKEQEKIDLDHGLPCKLPPHRQELIL